MASDMAKETRSITTAGTGKIYSNRGSRKNECSNGTSKLAGSVHTIQPICNGCG